MLIKIQGANIRRSENSLARELSVSSCESFPLVSRSSNSWNRGCRDRLSVQLRCRALLPCSWPLWFRRQLGPQGLYPWCWQYMGRIVCAVGSRGVGSIRRSIGAQLPLTGLCYLLDQSHTFDIEAWNSWWASTTRDHPKIKTTASLGR